MWAAGALRGWPASITATRRRARPSTSAALSPAAPPPTITTSRSWLQFMGMNLLDQRCTAALLLTTLVAVSGNSYTLAMATSPEIQSVLAEVGGRLRQVRTQKGVTLTELAAATGISKSTL